MRAPEMHRPQAPPAAAISCSSGQAGQKPHLVTPTTCRINSAPRSPSCLVAIIAGRQVITSHTRSCLASRSIVLVHFVTWICGVLKNSPAAAPLCAWQPRAPCRCGCVPAPAASAAPCPLSAHRTMGSGALLRCWQLHTCMHATAHEPPSRVSDCVKSHRIPCSESLSGQPC